MELLSLGARRDARLAFTASNASSAAGVRRKVAGTLSLGRTAVRTARRPRAARAVLL